MSRDQFTPGQWRRVAQQGAEQVSFGERVLGVLLAVLIGVCGAMLCAHWWAS